MIELRHILKLTTASGQESSSARASMTHPPVVAYLLINESLIITQAIQRGCPWEHRLIRKIAAGANNGDKSN
jgi:hypothetical protein